MKKNLRRMAAGLLSAVLAMTLLMPFALAASDNAEPGIAPCSVECPNCRGDVKVSITTNDTLTNEHERPCIHKPHGTDKWGTSHSLVVEKCLSCGWSNTYTTETEVLVKCYGSF